MDETVRTIVSVLSACVAILGAILAHRTKLQTRRDLFIAQRDALVLKIVENDARCTHLRLQCEMAKEDLERIKKQPSLAAEDLEEATTFLTQTDELELLTHQQEGRTYGQEVLDKLEYNEESLNVLRSVGRGEQVYAILLAPGSYDLIFKRIADFVDRRSKGGKS